MNVQLDSIPTEELDHLKDFINGINEFLKECYKFTKPSEMILLAMPDPKEWIIEDLFCIQRLITFHFGKNPILKLLNVIMAKSLIPELKIHNTIYQSAVGHFQQEYLNERFENSSNEPSNRSNNEGFHVNQSSIDSPNRSLLYPPSDFRSVPNRQNGSIVTGSPKSFKDDSITGSFRENSIKPPTIRDDLSPLEIMLNRNSFDSISEDMAEVSISDDTFLYVSDLDWEYIEVLSQCIGSSTSDQCSSTFVINGDHTITGKPILACDLWGSSSVPSLWYRCRLTLKQEKCEDSIFDVNGFSIVGLPYLPIGHNQNVSWGITPSHFSDTTELFVEVIDPSDTSRYFTNDRWHYATTINEQIVVRGQKFPLDEKVRITRNGPILSHLFKNHGSNEHYHDISISNPALTDWDCIPIAGFRRFCTARNSEELFHAAESIKYMPIIISFADTSNTTGWILIEGVKQRRSLIESNFPLKGFTEDVLSPENFGNIYEIYPPSERSRAHGGGIGRTFVIGTQSFPKSNLYNQNINNEIGGDNYLQDPFVGLSSKLPTRAQSIQTQLQEILEKVEEDLGPSVARNQKVYRGRCEEIVRAFHVIDKNIMYEEEISKNETISSEWISGMTRRGRISKEEVKKIQTKEWVDPKRYNSLLSKLLNFEITKVNFSSTRSMHGIPEDISLSHFEEYKKMMLSWDGSLDENCANAMLIQVFFTELFKMIFTSLEINSNTNREPLELLLMLKFGFLDTISPISYSGFDESFFELLLQLKIPTEDIIIKSICNSILVLRKLKRNVKSSVPSIEFSQYTLGISYKLKWRHFMPYNITSSFDLESKQSAGGLVALDVESCISHDGKYSSNYSAFCPNYSMSPFKRHTTSLIRFVIDMNDPEGSEYIFGPGNSGFVGTKYYNNLVNDYSKKQYIKMHLPKSKHVLQLVPTRRIISKLEIDDYEVTPRNEIENENAIEPEKEVNSIATLIEPKV